MTSIFLLVFSIFFLCLQPAIFQRKNRVISPVYLIVESCNAGEGILVISTGHVVGTGLNVTAVARFFPNNPNRTLINSLVIYENVEGDGGQSISDRLFLLDDQGFETSM